MTTTPADLTRLAFGKLNASLVMPNNPAMIQARYSSETLVHTPNVVESPELHTSGQVADQVLVGSGSAGNVEFPLIRHEWWHEMLAAVFRNAWGTGTWGDDALDPGNTWVNTPVGANELIPAKTMSYYGVQKRFETPSAQSYHLYDRCAVNTLGLRIVPKEIIMGTVGLIGGTMTATEADIVGATYADPGQYGVFTAPKLVEFSIEGMPAGMCASSVNLNFNSNLRGIPCVGSEADREQGMGRFTPMIDAAIYFVSNDYVDALLAQTAMKVTVELSDGAGNGYEFFYPRCKFVNAPVSTPGMNQDVVQPVSMRALYHKDYKFACKVKRTLAA